MKRVGLFVVLVTILSLLAGCGATPTPEVIEKVVEKEVTRVVEETIVETVVVEGTPEVVEKVVTKTVQEVVTATPAPEESADTSKSGGILNRQMMGITQFDPIYVEDSTFHAVSNIFSLLFRLDSETGGVFPDLVIQDDTLTTVEQSLIVESARAEIPLTLRITEFAFEQVQRLKESTGPQELAPEVMEPFFDLLETEGLAAEIAQHPEARDYLSWRVRMAFAQRAEHYDHALEFQAERDRVLAEAIRFLEGSATQAELFAAVEKEAARTRRAQEPSQPSGSRE